MTDFIIQITERKTNSLVGHFPISAKHLGEASLIAQKIVKDRNWTQDKYEIWVGTKLAYKIYREGKFN